MCVFPMSEGWAPGRRWYLVETPYRRPKDSQRVKGRNPHCQLEEALTGSKALQEREPQFG